MMDAGVILGKCDKGAAPRWVLRKRGPGACWGRATGEAGAETNTRGSKPRPDPQPLPSLLQVGCVVRAECTPS